MFRFSFFYCVFVFHCAITVWWWMKMFKISAVLTDDCWFTFRFCGFLHLFLTPTGLLLLRLAFCVYLGIFLKILFDKPSTRTKFGERGFCVAGSVAWMSLSPHLRSITHTSVFNYCKLNTALLSQAFNRWRLSASTSGWLTQSGAIQIFVCISICKLAAWKDSSPKCHYRTSNGIVFRTTKNWQRVHTTACLLLSIWSNT